MSITHRLKIQSIVTSKQTLEMLLSGNIGLRQSIDDELRGEGLHIGAIRMTDAGKSNLFEEHGVRANITVMFDENTDEDANEGIKIVGKAVALLLNSDKNGDAIFFYVADTPILKRAGGKITVINEGHFTWLTDALDEAELSYDLRQAEAIYA